MKCRRCLEAALKELKKSFPAGIPRTAVTNAVQSAPDAVTVIPSGHTSYAGCIDCFASTLGWGGYKII